MRKKHKLPFFFVVIGLPAIIFLFIVGWSLSWIGEKRGKKQD